MTTDTTALADQTGRVDTSDARRQSVNRALVMVSRFGGPVILVLLIVIYSVILPSTFPTLANFRALITEQAVPGILAAALLFPLVAGAFDFSGGAVITLAAVAFVQFTGQQHIGWPAACLLVLAGAVVVGIVNGVLIAHFRYNSFVATLATGGILSGIALVRSQGQTLFQGVPSSFLHLGRNRLLGIPLPIYYLVVVFLLVGYVLRQTAFGRYHEALGKGPAAAQLAGVSFKRHLVTAFIASAVLAALAGLILVANLGSAPPGVGDAYILSAFAAAFLGSTMFRPGSFNASGSLVAILLIAVGVNGLTLAGVSSFIQEIFTGGLLIIAVGVSQLERVTR